MIKEKIKPVKGKKHTKETRQKMSISRRKYLIKNPHPCKGCKSPNKGKTNVEIYGQEKANMLKQKSSISHTGKIMSKESNLKRSEKMKGRIVSDETRSRMSVAMKNRTITWRDKMVANRIKNKKTIGDKNPNWKGGKSFEEYPQEFNKTLKHKIRKRDGFKCKECDYSEKKLGRKLSIHHIDYNKKNNNEDNLISLCISCHMQTNFKRNDWKNYFRGKLKS